jgi:hypothetical protein
VGSRVVSRRTSSGRCCHTASRKGCRSAGASRNCSSSCGLPSASGCSACAVAAQDSAHSLRCKGLVPVEAVTPAVQQVLWHPETAGKVPSSCACSLLALISRKRLQQAALE